MKLYWRFKKPDGKWSYRRARTSLMDDGKLVVAHWRPEE